MLLVAEIDADSWAGRVDTTSESWSILRQSNNLSFTIEQSVVGTVSPVTVQGGRVLSSYSSYYEDVNMNDVRLRQRTAALEGSYRSEERLKLNSSVNDVSLDIDKPSGTDIYTVNFYEQWPVNLSSSRSVEYSGKGINDREFASNNQDFFGANSLYNKEFSKELNVNMVLNKMNATLLANDNTIYSAERKATRVMDVELRTHTSGIADIKYQQSGDEYLAGPTPKYEVLNEGDNRYYGVYDIAERLSMRSEFGEHNDTDCDWLSCYNESFFNMPQWEQTARKSEAGIFDCTCYKDPSTLQFQG